MGLKEDLYAVNQGHTLADNIDKAWNIYCDLAVAPEDREIAQTFLIYAFNLTSTEHLNQQLLELMKERYLHKANNPDYIPNITPRHIQLKAESLVLSRTKVYNEAATPDVQDLLSSNELLDVNQEDKKDDDDRHTRFFSSQQRAPYRVHIYQGKFYQAGQLFSTSGYESYDKYGYGAFTLNTNGELSVFNHYNMRDKIAHSSMNAGRPVICAGEIRIDNGELQCLTSYSGHYRPHLFNLYRVLGYFAEKGVNIANTQVYTQSNPAEKGLPLHSTTLVYGGFYASDAKELFTTMKMQLHIALWQIQQDTTTYRTSSFLTLLYAIKDWFLNSTLTHERQSIATQATELATQFLNEWSEEKQDTSEKLDELIVGLKKQLQQNQQISLSHGKSHDNGRLHHALDTFIQQATTLKELQNNPLEPMEISMKAIS